MSALQAYTFARCEVCGHNTPTYVTVVSQRELFQNHTPDGRAWDGRRPAARCAGSLQDVPEAGE